jgi:hypothetical protein
MKQKSPSREELATATITRESRFAALKVLNTAFHIQRRFLFAGKQ